MALAPLIAAGLLEEEARAKAGHFLDFRLLPEAGDAPGADGDGVGSTNKSTHTHTHALPVHGILIVDDIVEVALPRQGHK